MTYRVEEKVLGVRNLRITPAGQGGNASLVADIIQLIKEGDHCQ